MRAGRDERGCLEYSFAMDVEDPRLMGVQGPGGAGRRWKTI